MIEIEKYKNTRHWAVWKDKELVAVVCYKKGAEAIKHLITQRKNPTKSTRPGRSVQNSD